jgi:hypothetical protein
VCTGALFTQVITFVWYCCSVLTSDDIHTHTYWRSVHTGDDNHVCADIVFTQTVFLSSNFANKDAACITEITESVTNLFCCFICMLMLLQVDNSTVAWFTYICDKQTKCRIMNLNAYRQLRKLGLRF